MAHPSPPLLGPPYAGWSHSKAGSHLLLSVQNNPFAEFLEMIVRFHCSKIDSILHSTCLLGTFKIDACKMRPLEVLKTTSELGKKDFLTFSIYDV